MESVDAKILFAAMSLSVSPGLCAYVRTYLSLLFFPFPALILLVLPPPLLVASSPLSLFPLLLRKVHFRLFPSKHRLRLRKTETSGDRDTEPRRQKTLRMYVCSSVNSGQRTGQETEDRSHEFGPMFAAVSLRVSPGLCAHTYVLASSLLPVSISPPPILSSSPRHLVSY